jgi:hypothetical protein
MYKKLYHGSSIKFENFSLDVKNRRTYNETNSLGIWLSDDSSLCNYFAIKHYTKLVTSKTEFEEDGDPKVLLKDRFQVGGIYEVQTESLNLKEYFFIEDMTREFELKLKEYEEKITELKKSINYAKDNSNFSIVNAKMVDLRLLENEFKFFKYSRPEDSFDLLMNDRDAFCKYISGSKGEVSWKERYCLMNKEEANVDFIEYLKDQGYDGFVIRDTIYDSPDGKKHNQYCIFNLEKINITRFQSL